MGTSGASTGALVIAMAIPVEYFLDTSRARSVPQDGDTIELGKDETKPRGHDLTPVSIH